MMDDESSCLARWKMVGRTEAEDLAKPKIFERKVAKKQYMVCGFISAIRIISSVYGMINKGKMICKYREGLQKGPLCRGV